MPSLCGRWSGLGTAMGVSVYSSGTAAFLLCQFEYMGCWGQKPHAVGYQLREGTVQGPVGLEHSQQRADVTKEPRFFGFSVLCLDGTITYRKSTGDHRVCWLPRGAWLQQRKWSLSQQLTSVSPKSPSLQLTLASVGSEFLSRHSSCFKQKSGKVEVRCSQRPWGRRTLH